MKTIGRYTRAHTVWNRARSHLITNLSMLIPAGKSFQFIRVCRLLPSRRKSANRNFLLFLSLSLPRKPPSTTSILLLPLSPSLSLSLPWCIFRGNANSGSLTSTLEPSDISHRRCGREVDVRVRKDRSYTENISRTNFFPYPVRCPRVILMSLILRDKGITVNSLWKSKMKIDLKF